MKSGLRTSNSLHNSLQHIYNIVHPISIAEPRLCLCKYQLTPINVEDTLLNIIWNIQSRFSLHKNKQARCYLIDMEI